MQPYDWMLKYTPQTEWIQRRGLFLWLAFFFIELGAGMFVISSVFGGFAPMLAGWLICGVLGGGLHLLFLGKPSRTWRMLISSGWKTSWISRGLGFVSLFLALGLVYLSLSGGSSPPRTLLIFTNFFALLSVIYGGFAMNFISGIPLWNTALLPVLYVISGLWGGAELTLGFKLAAGDTGTGASVEEWVRILLIGFIVLIPVYLMSIRYTSNTGKASVRQILAGKFSALFWTAVVISGMMVPATAVVYSFIAGLKAVPVAFLYFAILCGLAGDLTLRYLILRCGMYAPLIQTSNPSNSEIRISKFETNSKHEL
jgi:formate-dependent nitrite reductase membrane component NrfD